MLQTDSELFNVESIYAFTSNIVTTFYHFIFLWVYTNKKVPTPSTLKLLVNTLRNHDNKVAFIQVGKDCALGIYY